jgi:hypothetical protein
MKSHSFPLFFGFVPEFELWIILDPFFQTRNILMISHPTDPVWQPLTSMAPRQDQR